MLRVHSDHLVVKKPDKQQAEEQFTVIGGFQFKQTISLLEELTFRQEFQRADTTHDADVILIQDIRNLVLYLAPAELFIDKDLIYFLNTSTVHSFFKALIIYFEYYLKTYEFVLIRRNEISGKRAQLQSGDSVEIKRIYSLHLAQYRLILAREYSKIFLGNNEMNKFYHLKPIVNISKSNKDRRFHESFLAFSTVLVWIAMHRRDLQVINAEMNRLFRSEHFLLTNSQQSNEHSQLSSVDQDLLYGPNYKRCNYRYQNSPLIQELMQVSKENLPMLWIDARKYRGNDLRIMEIELEFIVPASQLCLIDVSHGILGHPKLLYDTLLTLHWEAVLQQNYTEIYDPYRIVRQPYLKVPNLDAEKLRKHCQTYESFYELKRLLELWNHQEIKKWLARDKIVHYFKAEGMITDIVKKCEREIDDKSYRTGVEEIIKIILAQKEKLRKK